MASSTVGTTKTDYVFDGPEVLEEKVGTAAATHYTRGFGDALINRRVGTNAPNYYHYDATGSVTALSGGGALTDSYLYTAFGTSRGRTGTTVQPYQYLGNALDSDSGLYDFHARAYLTEESVQVVLFGSVPVYRVKYEEIVEAKTVSFKESMRYQFAVHAGNRLGGPVVLIRRRRRLPVLITPSDGEGFVQELRRRAS